MFNNADLFAFDQEKPEQLDISSLPFTDLAKSKEDYIKDVVDVRSTKTSCGTYR